MSQLGDCFRTIEIPEPSDMGERIEATATAAARGASSDALRQAAWTPRRRALALAVLAVLLVLAATPAGPAIADRLERLVGIGDEATLPPVPHKDLPQRDPAVVIGTGRTPDGQRYEIVADRTVTAGRDDPTPADRPDAETHVPAHEVTCVTADVPESLQPRNTEVCVGAEDRHYFSDTRLDVNGFSDSRSVSQDAAPDQRYVLTGALSSDVARVKVTYEKDGVKHTAVGGLGQVDERIGETIGTTDRIGYFIGFLPDDGLPEIVPFAKRGQPGLPGTVKITGFNSAGDVIARRDFGREFSRQINSEQARVASAERVGSRVDAARVKGVLQPDKPTVELCIKMMPFAFADAVEKEVDDCQALIAKAPSKLRR